MLFSILDAVAGQVELVKPLQDGLTAGGYGLAAIFAVVIIFLFRSAREDRKDAEKKFDVMLAAKDKELVDVRAAHAIVVAAKDREIADLNKGMVGMVEKQTGVLVEATGMFRRTEALFVRITEVLAQQQE